MAELSQQSEGDATAATSEEMAELDKRPTLEELLAGITEENRNPETDWGPPVGREVW